LGEVDDMAIPPDQLQAVAFLCEERVVNHKQQRIPIATVFFVAVPEGSDSECRVKFWNHGRDGS
jgi:hypothetical protein